MTVSTIYGIAGDGYIASTNATYSTARSGGSLTSHTADGNNIGVGQATGFTCYEGFVGFDTSVVGTDSPSVVVLSLWLLTDASTTDFITQARLQTWSGGGLTTADYIAGASLTQTLLASINSNGIGATGAYKDLTSEAAFLTNINGSGNTEIILCSDKLAAGTEPTGTDLLIFDDADTAGTTQDPKLVVTHAPAAPSGTGAWTMPFPILAATGAQIAAGTGAMVMPFPILTATGVMPPQGTGALVMPFPILAATGAQIYTGTGAWIMPFPVLAATGAMQPSATGAWTMPFPVFYGFGYMLVLGASGPTYVSSLDSGGSAGPSIAASDTGGTAGPAVAGTLDTGGDAGPTVPHSGPW